MVTWEGALLSQVGKNVGFSWPSLLLWLVRFVTLSNLLASLPRNPNLRVAGMSICLRCVMVPNPGNRDVLG